MNIQKKYFNNYWARCAAKSYCRNSVDMAGWVPLKKLCELAFKAGIRYQKLATHNKDTWIQCK